MLTQLNQIFDYVAESFIHIWPYLLVTIPLAVAVNMSGASKYINRAFQGRPIVAVVLATFVGAFSPFCSCGVVPVIAALLISGVPLAPVMSFWLASPSMDPEIFFLTVSTLGWDLAIWRLGSTLVLSSAGGILTHFLVQRGWLGKHFIRDSQSTKVKSNAEILRAGWNALRHKLTGVFSSQRVAPITAGISSKAAYPANNQLAVDGQRLNIIASGEPGLSIPVSQSGPNQAASCGPSCQSTEPTFWERLRKETTAATLMVIKFMGLAFLLGALIKLYVPTEWITSVLGGQNPFAILTASVLGVPVYTSNLSAMPLVGGLLAQGMHPGAALAFLISGPITTLPAMAAVYGLVNRRVFALYLSIALVSSVFFGYLYSITLGF